MSYQEKKTLASIATGVLVVAAYCVYALGKIQSQAAVLDNLQFWGTTMLIFIGIGIAAAIVVQIIYHILLSISIAVKEGTDKGVEKKMKGEMVEDEMDKLIELKSMRLGFAICGAGFIAALISLALNYPAGVMLNILFLSFSLGSLAEGAMSLYYYRAGVKNGQ